MPRFEHTCEKCGDVFESYTVKHEYNGGKKFCDRCLLKRQREQAKRAYEAKKKNKVLTIGV